MTDLTERVARAIATAEDADEGIQAAISLIIEEAAKVAKSHAEALSDPDFQAANPSENIQGAVNVARHIESGIRSLARKDG